MQNTLLSYLNNDITLIVASLVFIAASFLKPRLGAIIATVVYIYTTKSFIGVAFIFFILLARNTRESFSINLKYLFFISLTILPFIFLEKKELTKNLDKININLLLLTGFIISFVTYYIFTKQEHK